MIFSNKIGWLAFGLLFAHCCFCQKITTRKVIADQSADSILLKADNISFDQEGNYCFEIKQASKNFFVTAKDTLGPFSSLNTTYSSNGIITYTRENTGVTYYKNSNGVKVWQGVKGDIKAQYTGDQFNNIALSILSGDTLFYYANGKLISSRHREDESPITLKNWVDFGSNEDIIYVKKEAGQWKVILNDSIIAVSANELSQPCTNSKGGYLFAEGMKPKEKSKYSYQFFIHTNDTVLGPVRTVWNYHLKEDGSWYYSGDDNGPEYIAINNLLYRDIDDISDIILADTGNYFFSYTRNDKKYYNHNGREFEQPFKHLYNIAIDKKGGCVFYGIEDYYLYKFVNGQVVPEPLTRYNVRPFPVHLSTTGSSIHCFITDDSMYLHRDDTMLFPALAATEAFQIKDLESQLPYKGRARDTYISKRLGYFQWGDSAYVLFDGAVSRGIIPFEERSYGQNKKKGEIITGYLADDGYFFIQKTGDKAYSLVSGFGNTAKLVGIDKIIGDCSFVVQNKVIFYVVQNREFIQYIVEF